MGLHKRTELSAKQKQAAFLYAIELKTMKEISSIIDISEQSLCKWKKDPMWQEEVDRILKEEWRDSCKSLQKIMINKAKDGDFKSLEYVLSSNGYKAPEQVIMTEKTINITIDEDNEPDIGSLSENDDADVDEYYE